MANRRKYELLQRHLDGLDGDEWQASFADIEAVIGCNLPASARRHTAWWGNDLTHSHALAWLNAGWKAADVDIAAETLRFQRAPKLPQSHRPESRSSSFSNA